MIEIERIEQPALFDYAVLDEPTRAFVQEKTQAIQARLKRTAEDIIAIGQDLIEVKAKLPAMKFSVWLRDEFDMSRPTAYRFMSVASRLGNSCLTVRQLSAKVLYELAAPSTSDTIIDMVECGQISDTLPAIREAKQQEKQPTEPTPERIAFFEQWQKDNLALGLDRFGDVTEEKDESEEAGLSTELVTLGDIFPGSDEWQKAGSPLPEMHGTPEPAQEDKERRDAHVLRVMGSSDSPEWYTPQEIIDLVLACFGEIDLDPCSNSHESPAVPARTRYTREDNGLMQQWFGKVYMNPPYGSEIPGWVQALVTFYEQGDIEEAIALLPARIDTQWFQPLYAYPMCNVRGRIQYANSPYHAPFPCVVVYLGRTPGKFIATFKELGPIMGRIG